MKRNAIAIMLMLTGCVTTATLTRSGSTSLSQFEVLSRISASLSEGGFIPGTLPIAPDAAEECFSCDGVTLAVHTARGLDGMTHYSLRFWPSGETSQMSAGTQNQPLVGE